MNFLAHLHVADPTPESRLGNLLGDFVRGLPDDDRFSPEIWHAIKMHRHVDAFTDSDPAWKRSRDRLSPNLRRFAGIVVDVFYDHFLIKNWAQFEPSRTVVDFIAECHDDLRSVMDEAPHEAREVLALMESEGWLISYESISGIDHALYRISHRSPILVPIRNSISELEENFEAMEADFQEFYPRLLAFVQDWDAD